MSTHSATHPHDETESGVFFKVATLLLGLGVAVVSLFALGLRADARTEPAAASEPAAATGGHDHASDHNTALPLESFARVVPEKAAELAKAAEPYDTALPPIPARAVATETRVMKDRARARRRVQRLGVRRGRPRPDRPRPRGPDGRVHAEERRLDPALDGLPRRPDRAQRRLQGHRARRVVHLPLQGGRPRRLHVPLR